MASVQGATVVGHEATGLLAGGPVPAPELAPEAPSLKGGEVGVLRHWQGGVASAQALTVPRVEATGLPVGGMAPSPESAPGAPSLRVAGGGRLRLRGCRLAGAGGRKLPP